MMCTACRVEPATSPATGKCSRCLYREAMGEEAVQRQDARTAEQREQERRKIARRGGRQA